MSTFDTTTNCTTFLRIPDVVKHVGLCKASIYKLIADNNFPKPKQLSKRAVAWHSEDIEDWINSRPQAVKLNSHK
jgi:prophage regulatory protein